MKIKILIILSLLSMQSFAQNKDTEQSAEFIKSGNISVPVYDFDSFEALLHKNNDTTYVVNFWATWCIPCVQELPYFEELNKKYGNDKLKVLLVSLDFIDKVDKSLFPFLKKKQLKSDVLLLADDNANSWIDKVDPSWSGALPATVIYKQNARQFFEKSFTFEELENEYLKFKK